MSIILLIIAVIIILNVIPKIKLLGFILQLAVITIGFNFHPLIGIFLLVAYACDWLFGLNEKKDDKQKEESNRTRTNFYEEQREYKRKQEEYKRSYEEYKRQQEQQRQEQYKRQQEQQRQEHYRKQQEQQRQKTYQQRTTNGFFTGCTTKDQLKKRHRELCKKYHPDKGGNPETFKKMQAEYEMLKIKFQ